MLEVSLQRFSVGEAATFWREVLINHLGLEFVCPLNKRRMQLGGLYLRNERNRHFIPCPERFDEFGVRAQQADKL